MSLPKSRIMASIIMACYQNASHIHVTTELGTNLDFNIEGRVPGFFNGCCHDGKGLSSASVEVYVAPVESDTNGTLILDGSMGYIGIVDSPVRVELRGGRSAITPEKVAINLMDGRIADNAGYQPIDVTIQEDGETAYFTSLPVKAMVQNIKNAGIPSALSYTAGSYVCNYLMYTLLYLIDRKYPNIRGGFIHVPYAMEQVVNKPLGTPSMDLHQIARGLEKAVEAVVKNDADLAVDMGTTH